MPFERRNPIPVGRYWIDATGWITPPRLALWFLDAEKTRKTVRVLKRETHDPQAVWSPLSPLQDPSDPSTTTSHGPWEWWLFEVLEPTPRWDIKGVGFPNVVQSPTAPTAPAVQSSADTIDRPKEVSISEYFGDMLSGAKGIIGIAILAYVFSQTKGR